jgi:hypothetical protein
MRTSCVPIGPRLLVTFPSAASEVLIGNAELPREKGLIGQKGRSFIMEMSHGFHVPAQVIEVDYDDDCIACRFYVATRCYLCV